MYLACNTYIKYFIIFIMLYTYATELYTYTNDFYCVNCHNARNLYHIRVIDKNTIEFILKNKICVYIYLLSSIIFKLKSN